MSAYLYMTKIKILVSLSYRFEVFSSIFVNIVIIFASVFLWKTAYRGVDSVAGINESQMITYAILAALMGTLFSFNVENVVGSRIREGDVAVDYIKPVSVFGMYFAQDLGNVITAFFQKLLPVLILVSIFFGFPLPSSKLSFIIALISCIFSYIILWLICAISAVSAFWLIDLGPMDSVRDAIVRLLSGSIVPIWFFPEKVQRVLEFLPFVYTYQLPIGIYIGKTPTDVGIKTMCIQILWVVVLLFIFNFLQSKAKKNLLVQGG